MPEISSICKLFQKPFTSLISVILFLLEDGISPVDLLIHFLHETEKMVALQTFLEIMHADVTMIRWSIFSLRILLRTCPVKLNGGIAKPYSLSQWYRNAILPRSGFHAMYRGSWWHSLGINRSILNCPWRFATPSLHENSEHW